MRVQEKLDAQKNFELQKTPKSKARLESVSKIDPLLRAIEDVRTCIAVTI